MIPPRLLRRLPQRPLLPRSPPRSRLLVVPVHTIDKKEVGTGTRLVAFSGITQRSRERRVEHTTRRGDKGDSTRKKWKMNSVRAARDLLFHPVGLLRRWDVLGVPVVIVVNPLEVVPIYIRPVCVRMVFEWSMNIRMLADKTGCSTCTTLQTMQ
jgi:hypothetical protein